MICSECQAKPGHLNCGLCQAALCRDCVQLVREPDFSYLKDAPKGLTHEMFCPQCCNTTVSDQIDRFEEIMAKAKNVDVYMKDQGKETRLFKRIEKPLVVENCNDREDTLLRLAFQAAEMGYPMIIDVNLTSEKVFDHAYQTSKWRGTGIPVNSRK